MRQKKKLSTTSIILIVIAIFILLRTPWGALNSFYYLLFCLFLFSLIMRMTNASVRKQKLKKMAEERAKMETGATIVSEEVVSEEPIVDTDPKK